MTAVLRGPAHLLELNARGVLDAADVHLATRIGALGQETSQVVLLALALCVRGVRQGSVALRLADVPRLVVAEDGLALSWPSSWEAAVAASPLVGGPLRLEHDLVYLDRYWRQEVQVASDLLRRVAVPVVLDRSVLAAALGRLWPGSAPDDQRFAAAVCALSSVSVLGGGPGTGKTTTVSRLLVALREATPSELRIALAAPTGKASARLEESVHRADNVLSAADQEWLRGLSSSTLHRLLGARRGSAQSWHHAGNRLPYDVVVIDEASMVSLPMFARLLEALRPETRLILVGDPDQLASVEAGAVLSDLVAGAGDRTSSRASELAVVVPLDAPVAVAADTPGARLRDGMATLTTVHRFSQEGTIATLARAIRDGDSDAASSAISGLLVSVMDDATVPDAEVRPILLAQLRDVITAAASGDAVGALEALGRHRLLCAHRSGPRGVSWWSERVPRWLVESEGLAPRRDGRFAGQPLLVRTNDYDNGLWNGDTGVVVEEAGELVGYFATGAAPRRVPLGRLGDVVPMYAMTVHRSQGSQFDSVTVVLPPATSPLGTRETLYTAVTRAESTLRVIGSDAAVRSAVDRPVQRASGLGARLR